MLTLICEVCQQPLAKFDCEKVSLPLTRDMFEPWQAELGLPETWESPDLFDWMCFYGHPPFLMSFNSPEDADAAVFPVHLKTNKGSWEIGTKEPVTPPDLSEVIPKHGWPCPHGCGKEYQAKTAYYRRHVEKCKTKTK